MPTAFGLHNSHRTANLTTVGGHAPAIVFGVAGLGWQPLF